MRPQHKTISQTGSVIQKHTDKKKGKMSIMQGWRGVVVTTHILLCKEETTSSFSPLEGLVSRRQRCYPHLITRGCRVVKWSGCSTEAGSQPLCHLGAGSYNCSGRAQSGAVFVSALISALCLVLFTDTALRFFARPFICLLTGSLFSWDQSEFELEF